MAWRHRLACAALAACRPAAECYRPQQTMTTMTDASEQANNGPSCRPVTIIILAITSVRTLRSRELAEWQPGEVKILSMDENSLHVINRFVGGARSRGRMMASTLPRLALMVRLGIIVTPSTTRRRRRLPRVRAGSPTDVASTGANTNSSAPACVRTIIHRSTDFTLPPTQNGSLRRRSSQPITWLSTEETKSNTKKASVTKYTTTQNKNWKPTTGLVAYYNLRPGSEWN